MIMDEEMIRSNDFIEERSAVVLGEAANPLEIFNTSWPSLMKSSHVNSR